MDSYAIKSNLVKMLVDPPIAYVQAKFNEKFDLCCSKSYMLIVLFIINSRNSFRDIANFLRTYSCLFLNLGGIFFKLLYELILVYLFLHEFCEEFHLLR